MTTPERQPQFYSLQQIYDDVIGNARHDPLVRILVLTYEFDDQQLVNLVSSRSLKDEFDLRRNHLRFIAGLEPVVIYDARKTREFSQLPHFLELVPIRARAYSCHHSKAYLIVTEKTVRLVLGSFNLTRTGLFSNREVFADFLWSEVETTHLPVLQSFVGLLREGYADHAQARFSESLRSLADLLDGRLQSWGKGDMASIHRLLASGYPMPGARVGIHSLAEQWRAISDKPPVSVFAVSPFFDQGNTFLADRLAAAVGAIERLHLVTEESNVGCVSKRHFGQARICKLSLVTANADDAERARIAAANDMAQLGELQVQRKLHAKILMLCGANDRHLVYLGSANFTDKAWNGDNHELGVTQIVEGRADALIQSILRSLAIVVDDVYASLADTIDKPPVADDEEYCGQPGYPDFIERIELATAEEQGTVQFCFYATDLTRLADYTIVWGKTALTVAEARSQALSIDEVYTRLFGGKNLTFTCKEGDGVSFNLPFIHSPELVKQQDLTLFRDPEDWLMYYLYPPAPGAGGVPEHLPGEGDDELPPDVVPDVDRESNVVIAMQRYLTLFGRVEEEFARRADKILAMPPGAERETACQKRIVEPLRVFAELLLAQRCKQPAPANRLTWYFQTGELALFSNRLGAKLPALKALSHTLVARLREQPPAADAVLNTYVEFCARQTRYG